MDLTQGISNMQSRLAPDAVGGFTTGYNTVANVQRTQQDLAKNQIDLETKKREQDIQNRLQKAIEESYDEKTGQPDYDKLALLGHKYGISAQQMDYAVKHIKDNWGAISEVAQNKQTTEAIAAPGWNGQAPSAPVAPKAKEVESTTKGVAPVAEAPVAQVAPSSSQFKDIPELTEAQRALTGADNSGVEATNGIIAGLRTAVDQSGNPNGAPIPTRPQVTTPAMDAQGNVVGTAGDSWNRRPTVAPVTPVAPVSQGTGETMDLGEGRITAEVPQNTLYQNLNQMQVKNPLAVLGEGAGGAGVAGANALVAPRNREGIDTTLNPQEDIENNTKAWLRNNGYNNPDYDTNYNQAMNDVASAILAKMPLAPIPTGDYRKDTEARNAYRNEVQKINGEAIQAKLKLRNDIATQNYTAADNTLKTFANTIDVGGKAYRARDAAARATALALIPIKTEIPQFNADLNNISPNDPVGLQMLMARGARLYAGTMNPGAQVSEGSLEEVGRQIFGEHGVDLKKFVAEAVVAMGNAKAGDRGKALGEVMGSYAQKVDGRTIKTRLHEMANGASKALNSTLKASLLNYNGSADELTPPKSEPDATGEPKASPTPEAKKPWSKEKPKATGGSKAPKATRKALF